MPSELFDPMLDLALRVAKRGQKKKPPIAAPAKVQPLTKLSKLPTKAKEDLFAILDSDEDFRARVAEAATEAKIGRTAMMFLERPDGWKDFVDTMVEAADEPLVETTPDTSAIEGELAAVTAALAEEQRARDRAEGARSKLESKVTNLESQLVATKSELNELRMQNDELTDQRHRAVRELKHTEDVMNRHIAERKRLEALIGTMTAAQLTTSSVGGEVTGAELSLIHI